MPVFNYNKLITRVYNKQTMDINFLIDLAELSRIAYGAPLQTLPSLTYKNDYTVTDILRTDTEELFVATNDYCVVIAVRGSDSTINDWVHRNLDFYTKEPDAGIPVHKGFYEAASRILDETNLVNIVDNLLHNTTKALYLTGHSSGGAVATFLGIYLALHYNIQPSAIFTFGSPRISKNAFYRYVSCRTKCLDYTFNIIHPYDLVPYLPWGYNRCGWYINVHNLYPINPFTYNISRFIQLFRYILGKSIFKNHSIVNYISILQRLRSHHYSHIL